jgi:acetyl esterase/lipase
MPTSPASPPLLILAGDAEVLLDDARKLEQTARDARVNAELFVYRDMVHVWMFNDPDAADALMAFDQIAAFVGRVTRSTRIG